MQTSNIVSFKSRTTQVMNMDTQSSVQAEDLRSEPRELSAEKLFVQITQASDRDLIGKTMACKAVDASAHGIKFVADEFIPVGCLLDLWVDDKTRPGKYFLSGDVRWTHKVGKDSTMVGVRLQEGLATDIESWKEVRPAAMV